MNHLWLILHWKSLCRSVLNKTPHLFLSHSCSAFGVVQSVWRRFAFCTVTCSILLIRLRNHKRLYNAFFNAQWIFFKKWASPDPAGLKAEGIFLEPKGAHAMNDPAQYLHFGFILISLANLIVIALLIVVFVLAVALRRPEKQRLSTIEAGAHPDEAGDGAMAHTEVRP